MKEVIKLDLKPYKPPKKTLWHFFWHFVNLNTENNSMIGYIRENASCDSFLKRPSKKLIRRYNIRPDQELLHWWLLEQYLEGNLIEKPKEDVQPKP